MTTLGLQVLYVSIAARVARCRAAGAAWRGSGTPFAASISECAVLCVDLFAASAQGAFKRWHSNARLAEPCIRIQEVRFLFPVLPLFNMCAAAALARLYSSKCDGLSACEHAPIELTSTVQAQIVDSHAAVPCCGVATCFVGCRQSRHDLGSLLELSGAFQHV